MDVVRPKSSKLDERLNSAIKEKKFYEVHQLYKTIYYRFIIKRNYSDALNYMVSGSEFLLNYEQWESGTELACLVIEVYTKSKITLTEDHLNQLCSLLIRMYPGEDRSRFIKKAIHLLNTTNTNILARFNGYLARILWQEGSFTEARFHIMLSYNGFATGSFLIALHQKFGVQSEIDLFITQAVLQFLCMRQIPVAVITFYTYTRDHPYLEPGPPFTRFPLLNFIWFLMLAIEKKSGLNVFYVLCEKYSSQLNRDISYMKYLDKIGQLYFGVKPPDDKATNFFSQIMQMFDGNKLENPTSSKLDTSDAMCFEDVD